MAGGSPHDIYNIFGMKLPKWKVSAYMMATYVGFYVIKKQLNKLKSDEPAVFTFEDEKQRDFVEKYIKKQEQLKHVPQWIKGEREVHVFDH